MNECSTQKCMTVRNDLLDGVQKRKILGWFTFLSPHSHWNKMKHTNFRRNDEFSTHLFHLNTSKNVTKYKNGLRWIFYMFKFGRLKICFGENTITWLLSVRSILWLQSHNFHTLWNFCQSHQKSIGMVANISVSTKMTILCSTVERIQINYSRSYHEKEL